VVTLLTLFLIYLILFTVYRLGLCQIDRDRKELRIKELKTRIKRGYSTRNLKQDVESVLEKGNKALNNVKLSRAKEILKGNKEFLKQLADYQKRTKKYTDKKSKYVDEVIRRQGGRKDASRKHVQRDSGLDGSVGSGKDTE